MASIVSQAILVSQPSPTNASCFSHLLSFHHFAVTISNAAFSYWKSSPWVRREGHSKQGVYSKRYWSMHYLHLISQHIQSINRDLFTSQHSQSVYRWSKSLSQPFALLRCIRLRHLERVGFHSLLWAGCLDGIAAVKDQQQWVGSAFEELLRLSQPCCLSLIGISSL